jgi:hypothetical protein
VLFNLFRHSHIPVSHYHGILIYATFNEKGENVIFTGCEHAEDTVREERPGATQRPLRRDTATGKATRALPVRRASRREEAASLLHGKYDQFVTELQ